VTSTRARRGFQAALLLVLVGSVALLVALRSGAVSLPPGLLAALVTVLLAGAAVELALTVRDGVRREGGRGRVAAKSAALAGAVVVGAFGTWNWLAGVQGALVLAEGESAALAGPEAVELDAGPLFRWSGLRFGVRLDRLRLVPAGDGAFAPVSELAVLDLSGTQVEAIVAGGAEAGAVGSLRFYQGAFGFTPRLVVVAQNRVVADEQVEFTTRREGEQGVAFEGTLRVEDLVLRGAVDVASLGEDMKGHTTLAVELRKGEAIVGRANLLPGHFAQFAGGYQVGYAGMKRWSEIDVSRRTYRGPILAGVALALLGLAGWGICAWRRW
jgi:hypothetical protein